MILDEEKLVWIKKVERSGTKYLVTTDVDDDAIKLTEDLIVKYRIIKGNSFYQKDWNKIKNSLNEGILFDQVLHYIDFKMRTEKEVIEYLEKKNSNEVVNKKIIKKLKEIKMLDDDRYTRMFIEGELRKNNGPHLIKYNLMTRGIKEELIDEYLDQIKNDDLYNRAMDVAQKTLRQVIGYPINKQKETIYSKLMRMGYDSNIVTRILNDIKYSEVDLDKLNELYQELLAKKLDKNQIIQKLLAKGYDYNDIKHVINEFE